MKTPRFVPLRPVLLLPRNKHAFSLVEVTLALGIVTFGLVAVVGVLPTALNSGRQGFDQNRAAAIATTLFASFRSQPFTSVCYVDAQFNPDGSPKTSATMTAGGAGGQPAPLDLSKVDLGYTGSQSNSNQQIKFYARVLNAATDHTGDTYGDQSRLAFFLDDGQPANRHVGSDYQVLVNPPPSSQGTATTSPSATPAPANQPDGIAVPGQACRLELVITPVNRVHAEGGQDLTDPKDQFHFVTTVANRSN